MSKFKVGDTVRIVEKIPKEWDHYVEELEGYIGKSGKVTIDGYNGVKVVFDHDNDSWYFPRSNVQLVQSEAEFIKKQIKQLKKRLKEIENE